MSSDLSGIAHGSKQTASTPGHVLLDGVTLKHEQIAQIVRCAKPVKVSNAARKRAKRAHRIALQAASRRPIYAQSTGVGANKAVHVSKDEVAGHGARLVRSHAGGTGPVVDSEIARAMLVVRLNQLAVGGSGVKPDILVALEQALNNGLTPQIHRFGAIGTSDMTALASTALCLMGDRPWQGGSMPPCTIDTAGAMAFMSSSAATLGEAALACHDMTRCLRAQLQIAALSFIALGGNVEALQEPVHTAHPYPGQQVTATKLRRLLRTVPAHRARRIQDPFCLRALPQVHGATSDALARLEQVLEVELNSSSENPLVDIESGDMYHNGNFHAIQVCLALDTLRAAAYNTASLTAARISAFMEPELTSLRPFLAGGPDGSSGLLIAEYAAQSAVAELRHLSVPDSLGGVVLSRGTEEHASFATQSAWHTTEFIRTFETVLACEAVAAVRALQLQGIAPRKGTLGKTFAVLAAACETDMADRSIEADLVAICAALKTL
jgi:histidine ammonia-lyase